MSRRQPFPLPILGVLLLGFALGAQKLSADNLWLDELYSLSNMGVFTRQYSPAEVVASLGAHSQNHVPLYFILGAQWAGIVGWAPLSMRYLSLLFGILLIAFTWRLAAEALNRTTALWSAILLTTSGFVLLYFHEIRMYTLLLLLAVMHAWLYWRLTSRDRARRREWLLFIAAAVALLYTHVFALFFFAGLGLHHLLFVRAIKRWRGVLLAWLVSGLAFLPYLPGYLPGALAERTIPALQETALAAPALASDLAHIVVNGIELLWLPLLALACLALWRRRAPAIMRLLVVWAGIVLSLMLFNEVFPLIDRLRFRFFLASMPFFAIVCAHFLLPRGRWQWVALPFTLVWIAGGFYIHSLGDSWTYSGRNTIFADIPPLYKYAQALRGKTRALDMVVGFSRSKFVDWPLRHGKSIADYYFGALLKLDHAFVIAPTGESDLRRTLDELIDDHPYLILVQPMDENSEIYEAATALIEGEYRACEVLAEETSLYARRYVYHALECEREYEPIHFENGIKILDKFGLYDGGRQSLRLTTGWEVADAAQLQEYNVSLQIINAEGRNVRQAGDRHLYDDILKWHVAEVSTAGLPPGDYQAVVILYDRESGAKVAGAAFSTGEAGLMPPILEFTVTP